MSVVSENMTRDSALLIARANVASDGKDWLVYEVENAVEITRHVRLRNDAPFLSDDDELEVIELCACGRCKPGELRCEAANVAAGDFKSEPSIERNVHGESITRINALTPPFDACKLDDLDRIEKIALAATPGPWHRGYWSYVYDHERKQTTGVQLEVDLRPGYREGAGDLRISHAKPTDKLGAGNIIVGGCGCCNSPFGNGADAEHIVAAAPDATLRLIRRAKMLARFVELTQRWLVTLLTVGLEYRLVLTSKDADGASNQQRSYRSPDLERLINHAWSNAPSGVV